ncbi:MAG: CDP-alcohol phosphatidyltransferase family protein, partial [Candidatus Thermoplasmatota archaeon]|nr:CDP-alcohol phosphatidyltransferase family protein [Candidatus Thermoplasmatota archaeon]
MRKIIVLSDMLRRRSNRLLRPLGVFMGRVGIRPNNLTFLGLALTVAAAWQLYASDHDGKPVAILPGVALMLLAGLADGGDGLLARAAGQTSVRG